MSDQQTQFNQAAEIQKAIQASVEKLLPSAEQEFFDSVVHLAVGPFVSKITFGRQSPVDSTMMSLKTLTVPTSVLTDLAINIANGFMAPGGVSQLRAGQANFFASVQALTGQPPEAT